MSVIVLEGWEINTLSIQYMYKKLLSMYILLHVYVHVYLHICNIPYMYVHIYIRTKSHIYVTNYTHCM